MTESRPSQPHRTPSNLPAIGAAVRMIIIFTTVPKCRDSRLDELAELHYNNSH
jgi:hypothetical protein